MAVTPADIVGLGEAMVLLEDVAPYRRAGAASLGIGSPLLPPSLLAPVDADAIAANARRFDAEWRAAAT